MWYRCLNDVVFGYCNGEPEFDGKPTMQGVAGSDEPEHIVGAKCKLSKATCGRYSTTHCSKEMDNGGES